MGSSFILIPSASRDIDEIIEYVLNHSGPTRALHVHQRIYEAFVKVAAHPGFGHRRADLADESLRVWNVFSYLVIYRPETRPLQIV